MECAGTRFVLSCSTNNAANSDLLCQAVDPLLTCSETASDICVLACGSAGACPTGYGCVDAGDPATHENACLPL
jgi:hypothetical protein